MFGADVGTALFYVDASALVKLGRDEPESDALRAFFADADLVSCELVLTEVPRAIRRAVSRHPRLPRGVLMERAEEVIDAIARLPLDSGLRAAGGALSEPALRALDVTHVAAAVDVSPVDAFVGYDERQSALPDSGGSGDVREPRHLLIVLTRPVGVVRVRAV